MHQIITKRQLYKLKRSLHLREAPLPEETTSKPPTMFPLRETIEECPKFKRAYPFIGGFMMSQRLDIGTFHSYMVGVPLEVLIIWIIMDKKMDNNSLSPAPAKGGA